MLRRVTWVLSILVAAASGGREVAGEQPVDLRAADPYLPKQEVQGQLQLIGAATMQQLAALWSDGFRHIHPQVQIRTDCGGSEIALPALAKDQSVLGLMSRPLEREEQQKLEKELACRVVPVTVCLDVLGVIVHSSNPLRGLNWDSDSSRLGITFDTSKTATWGDLGLEGDWKSLPISLHGFGRQSGTRWHADRILAISETGASAVQEHASQTDLVKAVAADRGGLGLVSLSRGELPDVRLLPLASDGQTFVAATDDQTTARRYPLTRPLFLLAAVPGETLDAPLVEEFLAYVLSRDGQHDVAKDGFVPLDRAELDAQRERLGWMHLE